jgi:hypothetical protein
MTRQKILNVLLIASFGAVAATAGAQTTPAQNNTPRNAPTGTTAAPPTGTTGDAYGGTTAPSDSTMKTPGTAMDSSLPTDMSGYKAARAACDKQPLNSRDQCRTTLNARYGSLAPKCQKLSGSALDDCLKGADTGQ